MTRLVPITLALLCSVALMGARCTKEEIDHYSALLTGTPSAAVAAPAPVALAALTVEPESSEEVVSVAAVVEPELSSEYVPTAHVSCYQTPWRDTFQTFCETSWY